MTAPTFILVIGKLVKGLNPLATFLIINLIWSGHVKKIQVGKMNSTIRHSAPPVFYTVFHFQGQGITPDGFLSPLRISESSQELGLRAASFSLDIVRS